MSSLGPVDSVLVGVDSVLVGVYRINMKFFQEVLRDWCLCCQVQGGVVILEYRSLPEDHLECLW